MNNRSQDHVRVPQQALFSLHGPTYTVQPTRSEPENIACLRTYGSAHLHITTTSNNEQVMTSSKTSLPFWKYNFSALKNDLKFTY